MSLLSLKALRSIASRSFSIRTCLAAGDGSGVGHGGGSGGSIRDAGGSFGRKEAAAENTYFRKIEAEQLAALAKKHDEEIKHHEEEIKRHQENIQRHRQQKDGLKKTKQ